MVFTNYSLGLGNRGNSPSIVGITMNEAMIPRERTTLRKAFPTTTQSNGSFLMTGNFAQTPFRIAFNAGDANLKQNATGTNVSSANQHFVYDSSDYIRFKKLQAKNRNYNDKKF